MHDIYSQVVLPTMPRWTVLIVFEGRGVVVGYSTSVLLAVGTNVVSSIPHVVETKPGSHI